MKNSKKLIALGTALLMSLSMFNVSAVDAYAKKQNVNPVESTYVEKDADTLISEMITYYANYQDKAATDIQRTLQELKAVDELQYEQWLQIMDYWSYINSDMPVNIGKENYDTTLPQDDSLCIVILGFQLNPDGTMKDELIGRLQAGLDYANMYPNSYVVVTGGGTAANNPNVTEGELMGEWLLENGLDENRLIVENRAPDTIGNAENTFKILNEKYPSVKHLVMVTSYYHVPRGCILYYTKCLLTAYELGQTPLDIVSNAGSETDNKGYESIGLQAWGVASIAGVGLLDQLPLSDLTGLTITQNKKALRNGELDLNVTAHYNSGFERDVTDLVEVTEFNPELGEKQTVTVSYSENGITISEEMNLNKNNVKVVDNTYLQNLIEEVEGLNLKEYTKDSIAVLNAALIDAKHVVDKNVASETRILDAYNKLNDAKENLVQRENLALNKKAEASSYEGNNSGAKVTDGNKTTGSYWASKAPTKESEVMIDLEGTYNVDYIKVYPYFGGNRIYKYKLYGSTDKENWTLIGENSSDEFVTSNGIAHDMDTEIAYVKLVGEETYVAGRPDIVNLHICEIEVFEK